MQCAMRDVNILFVLYFFVILFFLVRAGSGSEGSRLQPGRTQSDVMLRREHRLEAATITLQGIKNGSEEHADCPLTA